MMENINGNIKNNNIQITMQETTSGVKIPVILDRYNSTQKPNKKERFIDRTLEYFGNIIVKTVECFLWLMGK